MKKQARPIIKLELTALDKGLEVSGWALLVVTWVLVLVSFSALPETIPVHYNFAGEADGFGNKWNLLTLPGIASVLFIGMTILNWYPHIFNYPATITDENAVQYYKMGTQLIRVLKLVIVLIFGLITVQTLQNAHGNEEGLGSWFLPVTLGLIFIPIVFFLVRMIKLNK